MNPGARFVSECEPYLEASWPFFGSKPGEAGRPDLLPVATALHIKHLQEPVDDADTIFFWNALRDAQKDHPLTPLERLAASAGAAICDPAKARVFVLDAKDDPWLMCHHRIAAGMDLGIRNSINWSVAITEKSRLDLQWLMVRTLRVQEKPYPWLAIAAQSWENRISKAHPGRMGEVFAGLYGADHPFARWMQGAV